MAYITYDNLWRSDSYKNVSAKNKVQDINLIQVELKVNGSFQKDGKTANFDTSHDEDDIKKIYMEKKLSKTDGHLSLKEKNHQEFKLKNKQSVEEILAEKAVKTTLQAL